MNTLGHPLSVQRRAARSLSPARCPRPPALRTGSLVYLHQSVSPPVGRSGRVDRRRRRTRDVSPAMLGDGGLDPGNRREGRRVPLDAVGTVLPGNPLPCPGDPRPQNRLGTVSKTQSVLVSDRGGRLNLLESVGSRRFGAIQGDPLSKRPISDPGGLGPGHTTTGVCRDDPGSVDDYGPRGRSPGGHDPPPGGGRNPESSGRGRP